MVGMQMRALENENASELLSFMQYTFDILESLVPNACSFVLLKT